jgi:hypothetical protein
MNGSWVPILTSADRAEAELVRGLLEAEDIPAVVEDQRSTVYPWLGEVRVCVQPADVVRALYLVRQRDPS